MRKEINNKIINYRDDCYDDYVINDLMINNTYNKIINYSLNDIWLDGGANIGVFAIDNFNKVKKIICFEPEKENLNLITKNVKDNNINNVIIEQKLIVDNNDKERSFYIGKTPMSYRESFNGKGIRGRKEIKVNAKNINSIIQEYSINCLKLDIEGGEYNIIKAIENWENINKIFCEYHFNILRDKDKSKYNEIISILKNNFNKHNYKIDTKRAWHTNIYFEKI